MTHPTSQTSATADLGPGTLLFHRQAWWRVRRQTPGAYVVGLPHDNRRLRADLLLVADRLSSKGLPVTVVGVHSFMRPSVPRP